MSCEEINSPTHRYWTKDSDSKIFEMFIIRHQKEVVRFLSFSRWVPYKPYWPTRRFHPQIYYSIKLSRKAQITLQLVLFQKKTSHSATFLLLFSGLPYNESIMDLDSLLEVHLCLVFLYDFCIFFLHIQSLFLFLFSFHNTW